MKVASTAILLTFPVMVHAHHSRSEYDMENPIELRGEVVWVSWRNPHIEIRLRESQSGEEWYLESASAVAMNRAGVPAGTVETGMVISVAGGPSSRRPNSMQATNFLLPSGIEFVTNPNVAARFSSDTIGQGRDSGRHIVSGGLTDGRGIFRVWTWEPVPDGTIWMLRSPDAYALTEKAREAAADWDEYDPGDNLELQCIRPGMPSTMGNPHPMEIVDLDGAIEIRNEEFDVVRTVHFGPTRDSVTIAPSPLGYSVGRWEGNTLVVRTTRINAPYFNRRGVPLSQLAQVDERFAVDAEAGVLNYVMTVTDPETFTQPFVEELRWVWNEFSSVQRFDCNPTQR
jgi:Family of unknown function (DUF6152)